MPEMKPGIKITSYHTKQKTQIWDQDLESGINPRGMCAGKVLAFLFLISICLSVSESLLDSTRVESWIDSIEFLTFTSQY